MPKRNATRSLTKDTAAAFKGVARQNLFAANSDGEGGFFASKFQPIGKEDQDMI